MKAPLRPTPEAAEMLAIQALAFIVEVPERLDRFLGLTGIEPSQIRDAAREPGFLAGVLEHMLADESSPDRVCRQCQDRSGRDRACPQRAPRKLGYDMP